MKSAVATAAGFLAVANAYQPRNFHWRRDNQTSVEAPAAGFTTLTVEVTEVATITSCKPTVTDCAAVSSVLPEEELEVIVVTNTVVLTETVCPITEAEEIESSVIQEHETGSLTGSTRTEPASAPFPSLTVPVDIPLSTGGYPAVTTSDALPNPGEELVTEVDEVETTATLTLTLGRGESASVVETVVTSTYQTTVVKTITACPGGCDGGDSGDAEVTGKVPGSGSEDEEEEYTATTTATTTGTTTVTVQPESTTEDNSPEASSPAGGNGDDDVSNGTCSGSGEQCLCPSAVTVTIPASTVYVTIGSQPGATEAPGSGNGGNGEEDDSVGGKDEEDEEEDDEDDIDEDECPVEDDDEEDEDVCEEEEEEVVTVSQTVTLEPVPYPTGPSNGTQPSGYPLPTGAPLRVRFSNAN